MNKLTNTDYSTQCYLKDTVPWNILHCSEIPPLLQGIFHSFPMLHALNSSHCYLAHSVLILSKFQQWGWQGLQRVFQMLRPLRAPRATSACAHDRTKPQTWPLTDQFHFQKKHSWSLQIYQWIEMWQQVAYGLFIWRLPYAFEEFTEVCACFKNLLERGIFLSPYHSFLNFLYSKKQD